MLKESYPYYLANKAVAPNTGLDVLDKYTDEVATRVAMADPAAIDVAIAAAEAAAEPMRRMGAYERQAVLEHFVSRFQERFDELAGALCIEGGKPIKDSRGEVTRLVDTFKIAAEDAVNINGDVLSLDRSPRAKGYWGMWKRVPIGPCSFISPFNFPLNLAAHKVAPALAVGCPFVLKPASLTPLGAIIIGEVLAKTDLPEGAFYQSGQSCISVQRIIVHEKIYDDFRDRLVAATKALTAGDPKEEDTFIGPIISKAEADRMESWIKDAVDKGADLLCGGGREGNMIEATLLENVPRETPMYAEEFFGPAALLTKFSDFDAALAEVNDSKFGLQAGVFTRDIYKAHKAWDELEVGGVVIGDVPSWRVDHMPYGGVEDSGSGREGIRYAIEDMTEIRLMVLRTPRARNVTVH